MRGRALKRVLDMMSDDYRETFESMSSDDDFRPLFDLWCESQSMDIRIDGCFVKEDVAVLDIRETRARFRVELRYVGGAWKVFSETRTGVAKQRAAALVSI